MTKKTVVIYTEGTLGDHLPFLALGRALAARGHRVQCAINAAMTGYAKGVDVVRLPEPAMGPEHARAHAFAWNHWTSAESRQARLEQVAPPDRCVEKAQVLLELCETADVFVSTSIRVLPWLVAKLSGVRWVTVAPSPAQYGRRRRVDARRRAAGEKRAVTWARAMTGAVLDQLGRQVDRLPATSSGFRSPTVLVASSPRYSRPVRQGREVGVTATGFWFYEDPAWRRWQPDAHLRRLCEGAVRPIVLAMGSQPIEDPRRLLRAHVRAASILGRPLVVQRGWAGFSERDLPDSARGGRVVFTDFIPQAWLFSRAACAIQHGGIGSIASAIRAGCPLLIEPFGNDQFFNALRVVRLGIGAAIHPLEADGPAIAALLQARVITEGCRRRSRALAEELQREHGLLEACRAIESCAARHVE